jgi:type I restriction enzyme S subunit
MNNYQLSVKKYPVYKDSGVEWLGNVPEHWELKRLKDISQITRGAILRPVDDPSYFDENGEWYYLNISDVTKCDKFLYTAKLKLSELGSRKSARVLPNNIILTASATIGKPTINKVKVCVHDGFIPFKQIQCNIIYLYYFLLNSSIYNALGKSNTQKNIYLDEVKTVNIAVPSQAEQESIATYLDTKTAQCDRKIDLLTQKANQYGKLKQSLINATVTRGLDKSVPMKDSGVEWIGEIPEHWEIQRLHDIAVHQKTKNIGLIEKNLLSLSYGKIKRRDIDTSFGLLPESFETYQIVEEGNIILRLTDLQNDQRSLRVGLAREKGIITSAYLCLKFLRNIHPVFAYYLLFMYDISKVFYWFGGGLRQSMKFDDVKVFPFVVPPLSEQKAIADYLDTKTAQIDQIIQTINTQIEKLKELRKTLINDVVTGKIRV